jgi:ATP-binding cassette, subfamily B (MDR/TAP), member 1
LTLILISTIAGLIISMASVSRFIVKFSVQSVNAYAQGGSLADEVLSSVRNAIAFGTQDRLAKQYNEHLILAEHYGIKVKSSIAIMISSMMLVRDA